MARPNSPSRESSWIISHLGINPVSGGRPPSDRSNNGIDAEIIGEWVDSVGNLFIEVALF